MSLAQDIRILEDAWCKAEYGIVYYELKIIIITAEEKEFVKTIPTQNISESKDIIESTTNIAKAQSRLHIVKKYKSTVCKRLKYLQQKVKPPLKLI